MLPTVYQPCPRTDLTFPSRGQDDGEHPPVAQAFEPEALDWRDFSVVVPRGQIDTLPAVLEQVDLAAKQRALQKVWYRLVWRGNLREPRRSALPGPDAFEVTMAALGVRLRDAKRAAKRARRSGVEAGEAANG